MGNSQAPAPLENTKYFTFPKSKSKRACLQKLQHLHVRCLNSKPVINQDDPHFLDRNPIRQILQQCCSAVKNSVPDLRADDTLSYTVMASGQVTQLGTITYDSQSQPSIQNIIGPDEPSREGEFWEASEIGNIGSGPFNDVPALAIIAVSNRSQVLVWTGVLNGKTLNSTGSLARLIFKPCGSKDSWLVRDQQVCLLHTFPPGMRDCIMHGVAPGYTPGIHARAQRKGTSAGRRDEINSLKNQLIKQCKSRSVSALVVRTASSLTREGLNSENKDSALFDSPQLIENLRLLSGALKTQAGNLSLQCSKLAQDFIEKVEISSCFMRINHQLGIEKEHRKIEEGASVEEDRSTLQQLKLDLPITSEARKIATACLLKFAGTSNNIRQPSRHSVDEMCSSHPSLIEALRALHNSTDENIDVAILNLKHYISVLNATECGRALNTYIPKIRAEHCRKSIHAKDGQSDLLAAQQFAIQALQDPHQNVTDQQIKCVKGINDNLALELVDSIAGRSVPKDDLKAKCSQNRHLKSALLFPGGNNLQWEELKQSAESRCQIALAKVILDTEREQLKQRRKHAFNKTRQASLSAL
jgi:hypothetical protein